MTDADVAGAQSLHRAFGILRIIAANNSTGLRLATVIEKSRLNRSTVHRMLQALEREGLIAYVPAEERYYLGQEAFILGISAEDRLGLRMTGAASLSALARASQDSALLMVRRGVEAVCVGREEGTYPIRTHMAHPGHRTPLGIGGASLAILATLPDDEVEWALDRNKDEIATYPEYSNEMIWELVHQTRKQGFAVNAGRVVRESWAVAVAIVRPNGLCDGALSVAGVAGRIEPRVSELAELLTGEVKKLSERIYRHALANEKVLF